MDNLKQDDENNTINPPSLKIRTESGTESIHYPTIYEGLPKEFQLLAEKELNETEEKRKKGIHRLKEFTKKEKLDLLDDYLLLAVLRSSKFNLKKSENKLKNFVYYRREVIRKILKVDPIIIERFLYDLGVGILPYRDKYGRVILYSRPYGMHFENNPIEDCIVGCLALLLYLLTIEMTTVTGLVYFGECKSPNIYIFYPIVKVIRQSLPTVLSFPFRIAKVEILNELSLIRWFVKIMKSVLPEKVTKRIYFNGPEYDNLHKLYSPDMLPEEFGGNLGPLDNKFFIQNFLNFVNELKAEAKRMGYSNQ